MKSDLHENRAELLPPAPRTFLNHSKPSKTHENPHFSETSLLEKPHKINDYAQMRIVVTLIIAHIRKLIIQKHIKKTMRPYKKNPE